MDEQEKQWRKRLKSLRNRATALPALFDLQAAVFEASPLTHVEDILSGRSHKIAVSYIKASEGETAKLLLDMRDSIDPQEAFVTVLAPLLLLKLGFTEELFRDRGYRLPKWERPEWLSDKLVVKKALEISELLGREQIFP